MNQQELLMWIMTIASIVLFGGGAVLALAWAVKDGQFENFDRGARSIFDPAEPIGKMTDGFPAESSATKDRSTADDSPTE